eukprot:3125757-Amphidinium_carterae.1
MDVDDGSYWLIEAEQRVREHVRTQENSKEESSRRVAYFRDEHRQAELVCERVWSGTQLRAETERSQRLREELQDIYATRWSE